MTWFDEFDDVVQDQEVIELPRVGYSSRGVPQYAPLVSGVSHSPAMIVAAQRRQTLPDGEEVVVAGDVYLEPTPVFALSSKLVLPDGTEHRVVVVNTWEDTPDAEDSQALQQVSYV